MPDKQIGDLLCQNSVSHILVGVPSPPAVWRPPVSNRPVGALSRPSRMGFCRVRRIPRVASGPHGPVARVRVNARNNRFIFRPGAIQMYSTLAFTVSTPTVKDVGC